MINFNEYKDCMEFLGYHAITENNHHHSIAASTYDASYKITASYRDNHISVVAYSMINQEVHIARKRYKNVADVIKLTEKFIPGYSPIFDSVVVDPADRCAVMAAINTKNLAQNLIRVRSSNVWAYGMNVRNNGDKTGDLIVQFKDKNGGAGNVYIYYDFPVKMYQRWQSAPSVGHFFWQYIRHNYKYSKLTGNKRGVLPNAVNHSMGR